MRLYGDESGTSGENLIDADSPVFVYALIEANDDEADSLVNELRARARIQGPELKAAMFRRSSRPAVLTNWLEQNLDRLAVYAVDKRYMATAKVIDNLVEEAWYRGGRDFYGIDGLPAWMAASLYLDGPKAVRAGELQLLVDTFVEVTRCDVLTPATASKLVERLGDALLTCRPGNVRDVLEHILSVCADNVFSLLEASRGVNTLDPLTPTIAALARQWAQRTDDLLEIVLDRNPLLTPEWLATTIAQLRLSSTDMGYLVPSVNLHSISIADSHAVSGIQLADIVAGAARYGIEAKLQPDRAPEGAVAWFDVLKPLIERESLFPALWPVDVREHALRRPVEMPPLRASQGVAPRTRPRRNDPCPCGSGRKFKRCHGAA